MSDDSIPLQHARKAAAQRPKQLQDLDSRARMFGLTPAPALQTRPIPERQWVVPGMIPLGSVVLFSGDGGMGKSLLALQLASAAAMGGSWLDMPVRRVKTAVISCEDDLDEMHIRLLRIGTRNGFDPGDLEGLDLFDSSTMDANILTRAERQWEPTPWWVFLADFVRDRGIQLLILDSLYNFFGGNELSRTDVTRFMDELSTLAADAKCTILVLWHPSLTGSASGTGTSGSTAFRNRARAMLYLTVPTPDDDDDPDTRLLKVTKGNYGGAGNEVRLRWADGVFERDDPELGTVASIKRRNAEKAAEEAFLAALDAVGRQGRIVSTSRNATSYAPRVLASLSEAAGHSPKALSLALDRLLSNGALRVGRRRRPNRHWAEALVRAEDPDDA